MLRLALVLVFSVLGVWSSTCPILPSGTVYKSNGFPAQVNFVTDAVCRVKATSNNPAPVSGSFTFNAPTSNAAVDPGDGETVLTTSYSLNGLTDGDHKYHVHNFGDVFAPDGTSVENHFIGNTHTRPASGLQEVGLLNDGAPVQSPDGGGQASGSFPDSSADLNGINSILGRAVVIHGTLSPNPLTKATQCVIGWNGDSTTKIREVHEISRTSCFLEPTQGSIYPNLQGDVQFEVNEFGSVDVRVFVTLGSGSDRSDFSLQINQAGNILTPDGSGQTSIFTGTPLNPLAARTAIGQVGGRHGVDLQLHRPHHPEVHHGLRDRSQRRQLRRRAWLGAESWKQSRCTVRDWYFARRHLQ